jgi:predicted TIM-barrel fold metal-dependent hydrolase
MTAFVAADPRVLGGKAGASHVADMHRLGARGIKIHPVAQAFMPDDPGMDQIYSECEERDLGVIAHAGASKGATEWAEPRAYAAVLAAHPRLNLVLAHLGGARWRQARELAEGFANVSFDLCEIIAWTGAPGAPTRDQLGRMIALIGSDRVLFGTDFPWYDVESTIDQVLDLPHLSHDEKEAILGANAIRTLGLNLGL